MNLVEYRTTLQHTLKPRTVTFLQRGNTVCLGLKKRGFGKGYYLGIGGKVEEEDREHVDEDELLTIQRAACREVFEEVDIEILPQDLVYRGVLRFYFPHIKDESWNQEVYVFTTKRWQGEPVGKKDNSGEVEIEPHWILHNEIPFDQMWDDARYWLLEVLTGKSVEGEFLFDENLKVTDHQLHNSK